MPESSLTVITNPLAQDFYVTGEKGMNTYAHSPGAARPLKDSLWPGSQESSVRAPEHLSSLTLGQSHPRLYSRAQTDLKNFLNLRDCVWHCFIRVSDF